MGRKERDSLLEELGGGKLSSLYLVHGPDTFLVSEAVLCLRERLGAVPRPVDTWEDLEREAREVSLFPAFPVLRLSPPYPRPSRPPAASSLPAVVAVEEELPPSHPLLRVAGRAVPAPLWSAEELAVWLEELALERGKRIHPLGIKRLLEREGPDRWRLATELEKLFLYAGEREEITVEDVEEAGWGEEQASAWRLAELALEGRTGEGLDLLSRLLARGADWGLLLQALAREVRLCLLLGEGEEVRLPRSKARRLKQLFRRRGGKFWEGVFSLVVEAEKEVKKGLLFPEVALPLLVLRLGELSSGPAC